MLTLELTSKLVEHALQWPRSRERWLYNRVQTSHWTNISNFAEEHQHTAGPGRVWFPEFRTVTVKRSSCQRES